MKKGKGDFNRMGLKEREKKFAAVKKAFCPNKGLLAEKLLNSVPTVSKNKEQSKPKNQRRKLRLGPRFSFCLESIKEAIKKL